VKIISLVLYPLDGESREPRRLNFNAATNIITGRRSTGKTALIRIIEYCLGAQRPVTGGVIKNSVSWYGLLLQFPDARMFVARREPGPTAQTSTDIYVDVGADVDIPPYKKLEQNCNVTSLLAMLSERIGLPYAEAEMRQGSSRQAYQIGFQHSLFFNFLRDDELVSSTHLFHREDEAYISNTVRDVFPFFIGAMTVQRMALARELQQERRNLRSLQREVPDEIGDGSDDPHALELVSEARAQGLIDSDGADLIALLKSVDTAEELQDIDSSTSDKLEGARNDRDGLLRRQRFLRSRLETIRELVRDEVGVAGELDVQRSRLSSIGLIDRLASDSPRCPICAQDVTKQLPAVDKLRTSLQHLQHQLEGMDASRPHLEKSVDRIEKQMSAIASELRMNQAVINGLERAQLSLEKRRPSMLASERTKGRVQMYLATRGRIREDSGMLASRIDASRARVTELEQQLSWEEIDERLTSMLHFVNEDLTSYAQRLKLEHSLSLRLDYKRLKVIANTKNGPLPMNEIGGGANAVGYHLAAYAALHRWFVSQKKPVSRFIFFDQPTQPYYVNDPDLRLENDDDRQQVERMFKFLIDLAPELGIQVIVTDHALLSELPGFTEAIIADWHSGDALIPDLWPQRDDIAGDPPIDDEESLQGFDES
jgi:hypothetical protein